MLGHERVCTPEVYIIVQDHLARHHTLRARRTMGGVSGSEVLVLLLLLLLLVVPVVRSLSLLAMCRSATTSEGSLPSTHSFLTGYDPEGLCSCGSQTVG